MFIELIAPPICAVCMTHGAVEVGTTLKGIDVGAGWVATTVDSGAVDLDTIFATASAALVRQGKLAAGGFVVYDSVLDHKHSHPYKVVAGPYAGYRVSQHFEVRAYVLPDLKTPGHSQAMFSLRWER